MSEQIVQVVGGYDLHLYCGKCPTLLPGQSWKWSSNEFCGDTKADAYREARRRGWTVRGDRATCPKCKAARMAGEDGR